MTGGGVGGIMGGDGCRGGGREWEIGVMDTVRAVVSSDGVPIVAGGLYRVSATWQECDIARVEHVSRRGVVTVRLVDGGVLSGGVRLDLSASRAAALSWERLPDGSPML